MQAPQPGCRMSLITKVEVRYEGTLEEIDSTNDTVKLKNVRSFGTENRRLDQIMPASDHIYQFVVFRRSDIKELTVCDAPQLVDPAIMYSGPTSASPAPPEGSNSPSSSSGNPHSSPMPHRPQAANQQPAPGMMVRAKSAVETNQGALTEFPQQPQSAQPKFHNNSEMNFHQFNDGVAQMNSQQPPMMQHQISHLNAGGRVQPRRGSTPSLPSTASFDQCAADGSLNEDCFPAPPPGAMRTGGPSSGGGGGAAQDQDDLDIYVDVNAAGGENNYNAYEYDAMSTSSNPVVAAAAVQRPISAYSDRSRVQHTDNLGTTTWSTVSERITNLSDTLRRFNQSSGGGGGFSTQPKRSLEDYYKEEFSDGEDDTPFDAERPVPDIYTMSPQDGQQISVSHDPDVPDSLEGALHYFGTKCPKLHCLSQIDKNGRVFKTLTYGALLSRAEQIAVHLTQTTRRFPNPLLKPGDRVALIFPNWEPGNFMCAFYGCLLAGVIPVPADVPLTKNDVGSDDVGFMLQNCNITVALTISACLKNFPKDADGEIVHFKNWPRLTWVATDKVKTSVPRNFNSTKDRTKEISEAYIELTTDAAGVNKGVLVNKSAVDAHCEMLRYCCCYQRCDTIVVIPDFRRDVGLWHGVLATVYTGMHVIFVPYALMKSDPSHWLHIIQRNKASCAVVKSRDLHWATAQVSQQTSTTGGACQINLSSLKLLLMTDGSNPWAVSICDSFVSLFKAKCAFKPEVLCPCATSTEALTVSIRKPNSEQPGRGCLNIYALSYAVVKIESPDDGNNVLTLQDSGFIMPTSSIAVIKPRVAHGRKKEPYRPYLCKKDEIGEICVASQATAQSYWNFNGHTNNAFKVEPLSEDGRPVRQEQYVRSGLLGFLGPSNLVFIVGKTDNVLFVDGRMHNSDDIVATTLSVDPANFVFRGRVLAFTIEVKRRNKIVVVAEQRSFPSDGDDTESQVWMTSVIGKVEEVHKVNIYCLALLPRNGIPKTELNGLNLNETRKRFLAGRLNPCNIIMSPHRCVFNLSPPPPPNLPPPADDQNMSGSMSILVGSDALGVPAGNLHALGSGGGGPAGSDMNEDSPSMQFAQEVLKWRSEEQGANVLFTLVNSKAAPICRLDAATLRKRAERLAMLVKAKVPTVGSHVAVLYPASVELIIGLYAVLYAGCVPVLVRPPASLENADKYITTIKVIVASAKCSAILTSAIVMRALKASKDAQSGRTQKPLPPIINSDETMRGGRVTLDFVPKDATSVCYLDICVSPMGNLQGVEITHAALAACCRSMKRALELYPSRKVVLCLEPFSGMGLILWCFLSIFTGHETVLISPSEMDVNPAVWFSTVSQQSARDTFVSYSVIQSCVQQLQKQTDLIKARGINLSTLRNCVIVTEERPRTTLMSQFCQLFKCLGLQERVVITSFSCRVNPAVCFHHNGLSADTSAVFVSREALRYDRIELVAKGAPGSLKLIESATILPGVKIVIANPYTMQQCADCRLGEIWVASPHNVARFFTEPVVGTPINQLNARLDTQDFTRDTLSFARTGYMGFIKKTEYTHTDGERHDALFVVGSIVEKIKVRQGFYYPTDIEETVKRSYERVNECAVFIYSDMLVVVAEVNGHESEALNAIPLIVNAVIEQHNLIIGVVVLADPNVIPINPKGEKQRMTLRDQFMGDELNPIYIAYNL